MRKIFVPLDERLFRKLIALAERERRRPADQAAVLLEQVLSAEQEPERAGRGVAPCR